MKGPSSGGNCRRSDARFRCSTVAVDSQRSSLAGLAAFPDLMSEVIQYPDGDGHLATRESVGSAGSDAWRVEACRPGDAAGMEEDAPPALNTKSP
jgi:hypothetical protein